MIRPSVRKMTNSTRTFNIMLATGIVVWTALSALSLVFHQGESRKQIERLAHAAAPEGRERDMLYRPWVEEHNIDLARPLERSSSGGFPEAHQGTEDRPPLRRAVGTDFAAPLNEYEDAARTHIISEMKHSASIWFLGIIVMTLVIPSFRRQFAEREKAGRELLESRERLSLALNSAKMGVVAWDIVENKWFWDENTHRLMGSDPEILPETADIFQVIHPDDQNSVQASLDEALEQGAEYEIEYRVVWQDGSVHSIAERGKVHRDGSGRPLRLTGVCWDITEVRRSEEQRKRLEEELLQSQKIESVGRLAGGIAHDINNMLMPILGYAELICLRMDEDDDRKADIEAIIRSTERVRDITRQLLAFARKQTMEMRLLDLNKVVEGFGKMLRRTLREDIAIKTEYASSPCMIRGDAGQIEQIILNLAINAQDAMPNGGALSIKTLPVFLDEAFAHVHPGAVPGEYVSLAVSDNGMGMNEDVRSKIFEPFYTTKEIGRGTGLGLSMVYGIVKQHGGYIDVLSGESMGSTFIAYFPAEEKQMAQIEGDDAIKPTPRGTETLLVVEDQQDVLDVITQMLRVGGYTVLRAADGTEAQLLARAHQGPIELLITDVIMPGMNGKELYESLIAGRERLKVLYMSGYPAGVISTHGVLHTGINFIRKPCSYQELLTKVREVIAEGFPENKR